MKSQEREQKLYEFLPRLFFFLKHPMDELVTCEFQMGFNSKLTRDSNFQYSAPDRLFPLEMSKRMKYGLRDCNGGKISSNWMDESTTELKRVFELSIYLYIYLDFISLRFQPCHPNIMDIFITYQ